MNPITDSELAVRYRNASLVDVLDRVLDKGAVVDGDIQLCVAGIELVCLKLRLLLSSTATLERFAPSIGDVKTVGSNYTNYTPVYKPVENSVKHPVPASENPEPAESIGNINARILRDDEPVPCFDKTPSEKVDIDPKKVEQGLAKLVLTIVELLRKLMERQALHRVELGTLREKEIDSLGEAFMQLDNKMKKLKNVFGLKDSDLNLDLGPVGELI